MKRAYKKKKIVVKKKKKLMKIKNHQNLSLRRKLEGKTIRKRHHSTSLPISLSLPAIIGTITTHTTTINPLNISTYFYKPLHVYLSFPSPFSPRILLPASSSSSDLPCIFLYLLSPSILTAGFPGLP